jgi:lysophospholipase L1-like esterase
MGRFAVLLAVNLVSILILFLLAEIAYRMMSQGFTGTLASLLGTQAPYSNLGTSNWVIYDEELGYRLNPDREGGNPLSIRNERVVIPKPGGLHRIIFLGDSVTWPQNGFVRQVKDALEPKGGIEIINAGVPGYTSYQEVLFYKRFLASTAPSLVVWVYCLNDNHQFLHRFDSQARMLWTKEAEQSLKVKSSWDRLVHRSYLLTKLHLFFALKRTSKEDETSRFVWERQVDFNIAWKDESWLFYEQQLLELRRVLRQQKAKLIIVASPYEPQLTYRVDSDNFAYVTKPQHKLRELCDKHGIPFLDLFPSFAAECFKGRRLFEDGIHFNEDGHRVAASEILRFLESQGVVHASGNDPPLPK